MDLNPRLSTEVESIAEQRDEWRKKGGWMMFGGFALQMVVIVGTAGMMGGRTGAPLVLLGYLLGFVVYIYGCMNYARGKGKSMALGLVGLLGIIGLIILLVIKAEPIYDDSDASDMVITWEGEDDSSGPPSITVVDRSN